MNLFDILQEFCASAFQPGVNRGLMIMIHAVFICLIFTMLFLHVMTGFSNIHVWILSAGSTGLYFSLLWYLFAYLYLWSYCSGLSMNYMVRTQRMQMNKHRGKGKQRKLKIYGWSYGSKVRMRFNPVMFLIYFTYIQPSLLKNKLKLSHKG